MSDIHELHSKIDKLTVHVEYLGKEQSETNIVLKEHIKESDAYRRKIEKNSDFCIGAKKALWAIYGVTIGLIITAFVKEI